ncbi:hypothetical protein NQ314_000777 [Rhamnusium bicolor]|uniref:HIF-1 alpha C-terminal transactivation domain-containing protein n=1 Tax=Rhamnusium bicolor TaxID=1586634 RepID=A0AAV8ZW67_9CUCU|nr:hypothetical protein NQ314_000777 [Rhamnusium bicolor]
MESSRIVLKDEPDDLTHLAPVAGDVCVPLDEHPFLSDMLDDFLLKDNFGPLLTEEPSDPFISYRDFHDPSPQLLSPNLSKNSDCSLPSLNSPSDSLIDEDQMSTFMNLQMEDDPELVMKAPYIPMNLTDDLPLLMANDLMWSNNEKNKNQLPDSNSSLAQLLSSSLNKHNLKANDHGGGLVQEQSIEEIYNTKNTYKSWNSQNSNRGNSNLDKLERTPSVKRSNTTLYDQSNKRTRSEPKEKMSSELLHQLMSNNHNRGRPKGKSNWLLDSGGQKAACISQPSDSVLMNLLDDPMDGTVIPISRLELDIYTQKRIRHALEKDRDKRARKNLIRKNSISLLDPEATAIPSLLDLTQQDFEVNAPVGNFLLQGDELLTALDVNSPI